MSAASVLRGARGLTRIPGDVPLYVEVQGAGPAVVLLHGFGGSARNFRPQARGLRDRARVALVDLRGHARSGAPDDPDAYTAEAFVGDVTRVLDHLEVERAVVGGLSMGAGIALRFAVAHPERVRGLVVAAPPPGASERGQSRWAREFAAAIEGEGLDAAGERFAWGARSGFDRQAAKLIRMGFLEHPPHGLAHALRELLAVQPSVVEHAPALRAQRLAVLIVVGGEDAISRGPAQALAAALPEARQVVVPGAGHVVNLAAPEPFNAALGGFLAQLADDAPA